MKHYLRFMLVLLLSTVWCMGGYSQETVTDELTYSVLGLTGNSYTKFSGKKATSDAVYSGYAYKKGSNIQIKKDKQKGNYTGIVSSVSGGKIKKISISGVQSDKQIDIYCSKNVYSSPDDLFGSNAGTKVGTITSSNSSVEISGDYSYIGIRSNNGAVYMYKITIVWEKESSKTPTTTTFGPKVNKQTFTITEGEPFPTHVATMTTAGVAGTIAYASDNVAVNVDQNGVTSAGTGFGMAKITATFTPSDADADKYASSSAYYYIDYKEKTKPATAITFEKQNVTLTTQDYASFTGQTATLKAGETILTNELTYSKEDAAGVIATLNNNDGTLVLSGNEGTATVTANFAGNDEYASSTASYTITVVDPNKLEVSFDFTKPNLYGYDVPAQSSGTSLEEGNIIKSGIVTITNVKSGVNGDSTNNGRFWNSKGDITLRLYDNAQATISVPEGYILKKVTSDAKIIGDAIATWSNGGVGESANEWVATENVNSVTFTVTNTIKMANMTVYYAKATSEATSGTINFIAHNAEGYYATFSSDKDVVFTNDVVVSGVSITGGKLSLNKLNRADCDVTDTKVGFETGIVENGYYVPVNTGVLVYSITETATYYFPKTPQSVTLTGNQLKPAPAKDGEFTHEDGYKYYKLAYDNYTAKTGLGFYLGAVNGGVFSVKAGTAYLAVPESESNAKGFAFDGETTGIENVNVAANQSKTIYNLNGQRVSNMSQAGLYIVNGKKVVIRK